MSYKSRVNWRVGKCLDTCKCRSCRPDKTPKFEEKKTRTVTGQGIVINTSFAPDGSRLEKPMSQTYINHIRSRNSKTIHKMKPTMGCYGA